jgi:hypothetical protein
MRQNEGRSFKSNKYHTDETIPKSNKYHTDETIPKSNKYHTDETIPKSNIKIVERGKSLPVTHTYMTFQAW